MRSRRRAIARNLLLVVAWAIATSLAGAVEWAVVSHLGGQGAAATRPLSQMEVHRRLDAASPSPAVDPHTTVVPSPTASRREERSGQARTIRTPSTRTPAETSGSWQLAGGAVGAACRRQAIDMLYASPLDGWTYRLDTQTPAKISLEFSRGHETVEFAARCVHGVPTRVVSLTHGHETRSEDRSGD